MTKDNLKEYNKILKDLKPGEKIPKKFFELNKWMRGVKDSSRRKYAGAMSKYQTYTGMNAKQLIDEAEADQMKPRREREDVITDRLTGFRDFLVNKWEKRTAFGKKTGEVGLGEYISNIYIGYIKTFYAANGFICKWSPPKAAPKTKNERIELSPKDIRSLINACKNNRDKSMIITGYQGGFDAATVATLDIGQLPQNLIENITQNKGDVTATINQHPTPWVLRVVREKEGIKFRTCLGFDAAEYLIIYLWERINVGETLTPETPVYAINEYGHIGNNIERRITTNIIQKIMRHVAEKSGVVSKAILKRCDINPAGYHALRASFSRRLEYAGMPSTYIDYMQGHTLPFGGAYRKPNTKKLLEKYKDCEEALSISEGFKGISEIEENLRKEIETLQYQNVGRDKEISDLKNDIKTLNGYFETIISKPLEDIEKLREEFKNRDSSSNPNPA